MRCYPIQDFYLVSDLLMLFLILRLQVQIHESRVCFIANAFQIVLLDLELFD